MERRRPPGLLPLALLLLPLLVYAVSFQRPAHDTWTSLASGRHIARHGPTLADPFSFASRPAGAFGVAGALLPSGWVNPNWGAHLLLYGAWAAGGDGGLATFKVALYAVVAALLVATARGAGASWPAALTACAAALVLARPFLEIRAQDLGNLCLAVLLVIVAQAERSPRRAWWLPALTAVWCNLHGSWVLAPLAAATAAASEAVAGRGLPAPPHRAWRHWVGSGLAALVVAAVVTPYRLANLLQPLQLTVSADAGLWRRVGEWQSPFAADTPAGFRIALAAAAAASLAAVAAVVVTELRRRRRPQGGPAGLPWSLVGLAVATLLLAVTSRRFIAVAVLVSAPTAAAVLSRAASALRPDRRLPRRTRTAAAAAAWIVLAGVLSWVGTSVHRVYAGHWPRSPSRAGVLDRLTLSERELHGACAFLVANGLRGRMLNLWEDGGFLAWCQDPGADGRPPVQVLIDGRAQAAYDAGAVEAYLELLEGPAGDGRYPPGWLAARLRQIDVDTAVLADTADGRRLAAALAGEPGWLPVYEDGRGRVLADVGRDAGGALRDAVLAGSARFPDRASRLASEATLRLAAPEPGDADIAFRAAVAAFDASPTARALHLAARAAALDPGLDGELEALVRDHLARLAVDLDADLDALASGVYAAQLLAQRRARAGDRAAERAFQVTRSGLERRLEARRRATTW